MIETELAPARQQFGGVVRPQLEPVVVESGTPHTEHGATGEVVAPRGAVAHQLAGAHTKAGADAVRLKDDFVGVLLDTGATLMDVRRGVVFEHVLIPGDFVADGCAG